MLDWYDTERYGSMNLRRSTGTYNITRNLNLNKEDKKNLAVAAQQSGSWAGMVFDPSVLSRCGSIQRRYDPKFV